MERELLKLALQYPQLVSPAFDAYGEDEFTGPPYAAVRRGIAEAGGVERGGRATYLVRVRDAAPDDTVRTMVTELAVEPVMHKVPEIYAGEVLVRVRMNAVERRVAQVHATQARLGRAGRTAGRAARLAAVQSELGRSSSTASACECRAPRRSEPAGPPRRDLHGARAGGRVMPSPAGRGGDVA